MAAPIEAVNFAEYDFVDLGCSTGGSLKHCVRRFGVQRGIGVDNNAAKVAEAKAAGFDAVQADASRLDLDRQVSFVSMMNFLEHLPSLEVVEQTIAAAARSARDFLYIRHPSFEGEELQESLGVRQFWWHWEHHPAHIHVADYCTMFERLGLNTYKIRYVGRIDDTSDPSIIPTSMPVNVNEATAAATEAPFMQLPHPLWRRQDIFVALRAFEPHDWAAITRPTARDMGRQERKQQRKRERRRAAPAA
jgi:SAM-dependent methyltransferase